jgi:hypothetical protein
MALSIQRRDKVVTTLSIWWREEVVTSLSIWWRWWSLLVLVVAEVGKEGVGGRRSWSWSSCAARDRGHRAPLVVILVVVGAKVARRRPPPPLHAAADRIRLAKPSDATTAPSSRRGEPTAFDVGGTWCASSL